jgi:N-methylhydantoinase B
LSDTRRDNTPDPITLEIFSNLFRSVAEEMGTVLQRSSLSPNIKERRDFSCMVCDSKGDMVAQAAHIPVHLGSGAFSVKEAIKNGAPDPGDLILLNDPFRGGTHLPDITMVAPVFMDSNPDSPLFYVANRAHHADVGGMSPGSMPLSEELFQEGLIIPPSKLVKQGRINEELLGVILANVRTPWERRGDLEAQIASLNVGGKRLKEIMEEKGAHRSLKYARALCDHSERILMDALQAIPQGDYEAIDYLDDDGYGSGPIRIKVTISIKDGLASVDFTGSSEQVRGNLNSTYAITVSAVIYVFRLLMGEDAAANSGIIRPLEIIAPEGTIVNALAPAAVAGGNVETSQRIVDTLLLALSDAIPDIIPAASQGTMNNLTIGALGGRTKEAFAYYETIGGGAGAGPSCHGQSGVHTHMTNTLNTPVEALEASYPLMVERCELRTGSGGAGKFRGGDGIRRDIIALEPAQVSIISERRKRGPYGLRGGEEGRPGLNILMDSSGATKETPSKASFRIEPGDILSIRTPGGGGWGSPE